MRVLVGTPTFEYHRHCIDEFVGALSAQRDASFDLMLVDNSATPDYADRLRAMALPVFRVTYAPQMRERMTRARNLVREVLLRGDYTHLLFLDQDVILPPGALSRLLNHRMPIVSGVYCKAADGETYAMVVLPDASRVPGAIKVTPLARLDGKGLIEIEAAGFGCVLIERAVCERIAFRYDPEGARDADLMFSADARQLGWPVHCDTDVRCAHRYVVRDFARHPEWGFW